MMWMRFKAWVREHRRLMAQLYIARSDLHAANARLLVLEVGIQKLETEASGLRLESQRMRRRADDLELLVLRAKGMFAARTSSAADVRAFMDDVMQLNLGRRSG